MIFSDEDRVRFISARVAVANERQLKNLENEAKRLPEYIRVYMLDKIAEKRRET